MKADLMSIWCIISLANFRRSCLGGTSRFLIYFRKILYSRTLKTMQETPF